MALSKKGRNWLITLGVLILIGAGLWFGRYAIFRGLGNFLIREDTPQKADAIFVLSGNPEERMAEAARLYHQGLSGLVVPTGSGISTTLLALGEKMPDAEVGRIGLLRLGVDTSAVQPMVHGTSTWEESEHILGYAQALDLQRIMVVSSKFHTRRIGNVFKDKFSEKGIEVLVVGAPPLGYKVESWWEDERGLVFVNNEYLKLIYYALKY